MWRQDRDDWMLGPVHWVDIDLEFGPFTIDCSVVPSRANSYCYRSWSREEDARVQRFDGLNAWEKLPFSILKEILVNFLRAKKRQQWGTAACFLVPVWPGNPGWDMVVSMPEVFRVELQREAGRYRDEALAPHTRWAYGTRCALWAAILVGFFGLFRKDNLTTGKAGAWNTRGALVRDDVLFQAGGQVVWIRALAQQVGLEPGSYSGHSLRWGGATAALRLDVNNIYIKLQGDWKSDRFEGYRELDREQKLILPVAMAEAAAAACS
ncbi:hypothetical protein CYMTET_28884 [Cymbomonas tetramitiformis]|uniref:Tyr recombinase domain-containing protein n=1 Tax=Cymbomonas tetramitiformis TaxID=36881 RepID=A0AAE0FM38_9CHLO|nr:hypothetical protein CYMTET_28884 [Cymbomonas tetramitiformis]